MYYRDKTRTSKSVNEAETKVDVKVVAPKGKAMLSRTMEKTLLRDAKTLLIEEEKVLAYFMGPDVVADVVGLFDDYVIQESIRKQKFTSIMFRL